MDDEIARLIARNLELDSNNRILNRIIKENKMEIQKLKKKNKKIGIE